MYPADDFANRQKRINYKPSKVATVMGEGAKIYYKYIDDLSRHYMNARTAAEQARVEWLKDRVAWR